MPSGGTGVFVVEIAAMGPAVVRVGVETGFTGFVFCFLMRWVSKETFISVSLRGLMADKRAELATELATVAMSTGTSGGGRHCFCNCSMMVARCAYCVAVFMRRDSNSDWSVGGSSGM